jgi:uncharacterized membrane protein (DUF485 family)
MANRPGRSRRFIVDEHDGGSARQQLGVRDPWTGALGVGTWEEPVQRLSPGPATVSAPQSEAGLGEVSEEDEGAAARAAVYREVREGEAFRGVRRRYRWFAFPASAVFLLWYLAYVVAAVTAPGLMGTRVAGPVNVALVAALAQFVTTFGLTWGYAWHARRWRDRAALEVRWETQERTR